MGVLTCLPPFSLISHSACSACSKCLIWSCVLVRTHDVPHQWPSTLPGKHGYAIRVLAIHSGKAVWFLLARYSSCCEASADDVADTAMPYMSTHALVYIFMYTSAMSTTWWTFKQYLFSQLLFDQICVCPPHLPMMSYLKETVPGSIRDTCPAVRTVFTKRPVCHNNH